MKKITAKNEDLAVLVKVGKGIHQVCLTVEERGFVMDLIGQLHGGTVKVMENTIDTVAFGGK